MSHFTHSLSTHVLTGVGERGVACRDLCRVGGEGTVEVLVMGYMVVEKG